MLAAACVAACTLLAPGDGELTGGSHRGGAAGESGAEGGMAGTAAGEAGIGGTQAGTSAAGGSSRGGHAGSMAGNLSGGGGGDPSTGGSTGAAGAGSGGCGDEGCGGGTSPVPTDGLILWLAGDVGLTLDDELVTRWADQIGNNDAVQMITDAIPSLHGNWRNGKPAVDFDGVNDYFRLPTGFDDFSLGLSVFVVADVFGIAECPALIQLSNGGESDDITLQQLGDTLEYEVFEGTARCDGPDFPLDSPLLLSAIHTPPSNATLYVGGVYCGENDQLPLPVSRVRTSNVLGRNTYALCEPLPGHIAEVLLYRRALSQAERIVVQDYLQAKWAI